MEFGDEQFLQAVFDGIQDGISVLDQDLTIRRVNHAMEYWYDHAMPLVGSKCYAAYHQRSEPCTTCPVLHTLRTRMPQTAEIPLVGPEGIRGSIEVYAFPMYGDNGKLVGAIEYARDITTRKLAEEARRQSEERLRLVMDNIPQAIFWKDRDLVYLGCNRRFAEDGGLSSPDEVIGKTAANMPWGKHAWFYHSDDRYVMETDTPKLNIEEPLIRADGTACWLRANKIPLHDAEGAVVGLLTTYEDITLQKQLEQYMLHAERLAAMGRLAAALAHEINNPLHGIGNVLELVLNFAVDAEEQRQYLQAARREIERLKTLTRRILDFARPGSIERHPTQVANVLEHALALCGKQLENSRILLYVDLPPDLPPVLASPDHLTQVFLNLIINAIEAMPDGGHLTISARASQDEMTISFADTGSGIPPEHLSMIFEPFYTTKKDSTGLGLAISHSIIRLHGGTVTARNTSEGAVLSLTLPVAGVSDQDFQESFSR